MRTRIQTLRTRRCAERAAVFAIKTRNKLPMRVWSADIRKTFAAFHASFCRPLQTMFLTEDCERKQRVRQRQGLHEFQTLNWSTTEIRVSFQNLQTVWERKPPRTENPRHLCLLNKIHLRAATMQSICARCARFSGGYDGGSLSARLSPSLFTEDAPDGPCVDF